MAGIYIHIPFCRQACTYCNFHFSTSRKYADRMVAAIVEEIIGRVEYLHGQTIESIYFGGGTPSILSDNQLKKIFDAIYDRYDVSADAEITLEANPDDLKSEYLKMLRDSPVNRLSIGIQSFFDEDLSFMNRAHNSAESNACIDLAIKHDFDCLTIDLIYGGPTTTDVMWATNVDRALELGIRHISAYNLTVEPKTALAHMVANNKVKAPDDQVGQQQFEYLMDRLNSKQWMHYEISNFAATSEDIAVHNSNYWKGVPYLGVGPSAHSYNIETRSWNVANNARYMNAIESGEAFSEVEEITPAIRYNEAVMVGLRTMWGVGLNQFQPDLRSYFTKEITPFIEKAWVEKSGDAYRLTQDGKSYADAIASALFFVDM